MIRGTELMNRLKKFLKKHNPSWLLKFIPDRLFLKIKYRIKVGRRLDLENPATFTEKIQWLKLYERNPLYTRMVDKYEAKEYVGSVIGDRYVIPNIGVWEKAEDIDFDSLPEQFVIKCTHDSGGLVICKDKSKLDIAAARELLRSCMKRNWFYFSREYAYKQISPRIIAEEYLENDSKEGLHDYKVWCFDGEPRYIQYVTGRIGRHSYEGFYDTDWNLQPFTYHNPPVMSEIPRPERLDELIGISRRLAQGLPFLRADFYILSDGTIRFGELTFYPNGGFDIWTPADTDAMMGKLMSLQN